MHEKLAWIDEWNAVDDEMNQMEVSELMKDMNDIAGCKICNERTT